MPPKKQRRNVNSKSDQLNDPQGQSQRDDNRRPSQSVDDDNNVTQESDTGSSADSTLTSSNLLMDTEELDQDDTDEQEVVISASLNLGQNSKVELKTTVVADEGSNAKESPQNRSNYKMESGSKMESESPKMSQDGIRNEATVLENGTSDNNLSVSPNSHSTVTTSGTNPTTAESSQADEFQMPPTVTVLAVRNTKVYLIGTAHFSTQSQEDVRAVVRRTQPDCILLELCPSRRNILHLDEEMLLREAGDISLAKVAATLRNAPPDSSRVQSLLHLLLLSMSASLTKKLGMAPGGEFRAAVQEAEKLPIMPTLLLGDRPFNVTLSRAIASLSFMQKVKLTWQFLISSDDITKEEIEKCKEKDLLEKMLTEMTGEFPSITEVFVNERDYFLAHTLYMSAQAMGGSKLDGEAAVVAVVGMGHVPGICKNFGKTNQDEFDRVGNPPPPTPPSMVRWMLKSSVKLTFYGLVGFGAYKLFNRVDIFKKFENGFKLGFVKISDGMRLAH